ncbi:aspartyl-phosphate phosphatase Spo0E family protein [Texcoconibacillus texcoconensis]|uniref:Spo0E like sporulation regulatory protein n=1 Tax=Texcoconibacillus texcoconensis TaxID=1095777 RepID=A0A840QQD3_9BACI|nr:aspartyl-phosphate phosphatase Spo0E family protein [Texcoconibacillus texcoconensis]MBB5173642.1 hypothetical protein [Texcoconibacillus texcoconensis]
MKEELIEKKRNEMVAVAAALGLTSNLVLQCSQELDELLVEYQNNQLQQETSN